MILLITLFMAVISTLVWYKHSESDMKFGTLALMYWGASLMWFVDAVVEYVELGAAYFTPAAGDMLNDTYLGLSVAALGILIWTVMILIKDPKGVVKSRLMNKN